MKLEGGKRGTYQRAASRRTKENPIDKYRSLIGPPQVGSKRNSLKRQLFKGKIASGSKAWTKNIRNSKISKVQKPLKKPVKMPTFNANPNLKHRKDEIIEYALMSKEGIKKEKEREKKERSENMKLNKKQVKKNKSRDIKKAAQRKTNRR